MTLSRRTLVQGSAALTAAAVSGRASAQVPAVKIGVLADFSGIYIDLLGPVGVACAKQAVLDFAPETKGFTAEIVFGDHQNKADIGAGLARRWIEQEGVDMITGLPNSSVALATAFVVKERDKACIGAAVTAMEFTGAQCTPNNVALTYDAYMLAKGTAVETVKAGGKRWFFVSSDNAFGASLQRETARFVEEAGGQVVGNARVPLGTTDYSSFLLGAQSSGAEVLGLAIGGSDTVNCLKQANEFGLRSRMKFAAMVTFLNDIHALGLPVMQGLLHSSSFYWDTNDRTRAFTSRVVPKLGGTYPGMVHAGCYSGTMHYLKAVAAMGVVEAKRSGAATVARMKSIPMDDDAFGPMTIREDGRALFPAYLLEVKTPAESTKPWDYCKVVSRLSGPEAAKPLKEGGCPLVKT